MHLHGTIPVALLATVVACLLAAAPASANSGVDGTSTSTSVSVPTTKPSTETTAPATSSNTSTTSTPCTGSSAASSSGPVCQEGDTPTTPKTPDVLPRTPEIPEVPGRTPNGGGDLPLTGPGDVLLAIVLALLAGTGGILLLAGAHGREQIEALSRRSMSSPSGFKLQYREVLRQLTD